MTAVATALESALGRVLLKCTHGRAVVLESALRGAPSRERHDCWTTADGLVVCRAAHEYLEQGHVRGKVVLRIA